MAEYYSLPNGLQRIRLGEPIDFGDDFMVPIEQEIAIDSIEGCCKYRKTHR